MNNGIGINSQRKERIKKKMIKTLSTSAEMDDQNVDGVHGSIRVGKSLCEWWKKYTFPQEDSDHANIANTKYSTAIDETLKCNNVDKWEVAMEEEYNSLFTNKNMGANSNSNFNYSCKVVECKWMYKTKKDVAGHIVHYKARLVAKGFS